MPVRLVCRTNNVAPNSYLLTVIRNMFSGVWLAQSFLIVFVEFSNIILVS